MEAAWRKSPGLTLPWAPGEINQSAGAGAQGRRRWHTDSPRAQHGCRGSSTAPGRYTNVLSGHACAWPRPDALPRRETPQVTDTKDNTSNAKASKEHTPLMKQ